MQLLDENGNDDAFVPLYRAVPLPISVGGSGRGLLATPVEGTIVEVGFAYGRSDQPFIRTILGHGWAIPEFKPGEQIQSQRADIFNKIDANGNVIEATDQERRTQSQNLHHGADIYSAKFGSHAIDIDQHSKETVAGVKHIESLGAMDLLSGDDMDIGTLSNMNIVTGGGQSQIITKLRDIVIGLNDKLQVLGSRMHQIEGNDSLSVNGTQNITIKKNQTITAKNIVQNADTIRLNGGKGVITCDSICPFTGAPHVDGSTTVFAGK